MTVFKVGDRVRITIEGMVLGASSLPHDELVIRGPSGPNYIYLKDADKVELLEPEYSPAVVYRDANHRLFYRRTVDDVPHPWRNCATGEIYEHDYPLRPLTRLRDEEQ